MTILNQNNIQQVAPAVRAANQSKRITAQTAKRIIRDWEQGWDLIWNNSEATPQEVLDEIGTDAEELFELNEATIVYFQTTLTGRMDDELTRILEKVAAKPATTTNVDGSVDVD